MIEDLDQISLIAGLIGGLALFLFGIDILTRALKLVAGSSMRRMLAWMTRTRVTGLAAGAVVTAVIQSSSVTSVLLVGFISAGLMTTVQSVPVILGANIGTTITAQILALKVTSLALPLLSVGVFIVLLGRGAVIREYARIPLGLGMMFLGMQVMSDAMAPLRSYAPFLGLMQQLDNVLLAALVGAAFTALIQSSSATTGILIVMASEGLIALEPAIALALGANIGTCVTALLASIGRPRSAVRIALIHTIFNVAGVLLWIGFVDQLAALSRMVGSGAEDVPRQLANVHTFFNVLNALLFLGFTTQLARLAEWLLPDRPQTTAAPIARHLDPSFLSVPAIALDAGRREVLQMGMLVRDMVAAAVPTVLDGSRLDVDRLRVMDRPVDLLHREILGYLRQVGIGKLPDHEAGQLIALVRIANDLEHIGDLVATGLVTSARKRMDEEVAISPATAAILTGLHAEVRAALDGALTALKEQDPDIAREVRRRKSQYAERGEDAALHAMERLHASEPKRLQTYSREIELTEIFDDIFRITRRIARTEIALLAKR